MSHSGTWVFSTGGCMREGGGCDTGTWPFSTGGCMMEGGLTHRDLAVLYWWVYEGGRCHTAGPGCSLQVGV